MFTRCSQDELLIWLSYLIDTHDVFDEDYSLMPIAFIKEIMTHAQLDTRLGIDQA